MTRLEDRCETEGFQQIGAGTTNSTRMRSNSPTSSGRFR